MVSAENIIVLTNNDYKFHVQSDLASLFSTSTHNILLEPAGRNTAPAIALGMKYCIDRLGRSKDDVVFVSPSDHVIKSPERFAEYLCQAQDIAQQGHIVTFGIKPDRPETG